MKIEYITNNPTSIDAEFQRLLLENKEICIATAFIDSYTIESIHHLLSNNKLNCEMKLLIGLYNFFNAKEDLEVLQSLARKYPQNLLVKVSRSPRFHLKYYWFKNKSKEVYLIGSANLTQAGLKFNDELLVKINLSANDKNDSAHKIKREFEHQMKNSVSILHINLKEYPIKVQTKSEDKNAGLFNKIVPPDTAPQEISFNSTGKAVIVNIWSEFSKTTVKIVKNNFPNWKCYFGCLSEEHYYQCMQHKEILVLEKRPKGYVYFWTQAKQGSDYLKTKEGNYFINYDNKRGKKITEEKFNILKNDFNISPKARKNPLYQKTIGPKQQMELKKIFN
jgi:HKD family nuclease